MNPPAFKDHFTSVATHYADSRPTYPAELFEWLSGLCGSHQRVWDCATGSGQAAQSLAEHFDEVIATDASAGQIAQASLHPRITYRVAPAHESGIDNQSIDLVTVAQALHWFDLDAFYSEVRRVLKPDGVIAVWSYGPCRIINDTIDPYIQHFYRNEINTYWPPERSHIETAYRHLAFPFQRIPSPQLILSASWSLPQLMGYLRSWSATGHFIQLNGFDPVRPLEEKLATCWPNPAVPHRVEWPLTLLAGHLEKNAI